LNHIGLWIDDLAVAVDWLTTQGMRFTPGGIRKGAAGHDVCAIDNLVNGHEEAICRVRRLSNAPVGFELGDIRDRAFLDRLFADFAPDAVIHFAGLKAVGESVADPMAYYEVNVAGTSTLLQAMAAAGCPKIIFSSSATVYGEPEYLPLDEAHPTNPLNPYGRTKLMAEQILADWCAAEPTRAAVSLRYFNPVGAHVSGQIGEDPNGPPNNLMPYIAQVATGRLTTVQVFGGRLRNARRDGRARLYPRG
jgi:UDP-glucose 4-epimerase